MGEPQQPGGQQTRPALVVIGGSAGSHQPLLALMAGLPADLPASILVTIHTGENAPSNLPALLTRAGPLPAEHARHGQPLTPGTVLVAPPGVHLRIADGIAELSHEPRVNRVRPAIDVLFSSAAATGADGVIAVLLSGALDDGAVGAALIAQAGGTVLIQDPADARFASIPQAAQRAAPSATTAPAAELATLVVDAVHTIATTSPSAPPSVDRSSAMTMSHSDNPAYLADQ
jgi:two-component system chemotaxis response regulator CheB